MSEAQGNDAVIKEIHRFLPPAACLISFGQVPGLQGFLPEDCQYSFREFVRPDVLEEEIEICPGTYVLVNRVLESFPSTAALLRSVVSQLGYFLFVHSLSADSFAAMHALKNDARNSGFSLRVSNVASSGFALVCVSAGKTTSEREPLVVTLSEGYIGNFGDRLGLQIVSHVVPAKALVLHRSMRQLSSISKPSLGKTPIDLLILGLGNSLFRDVLSEDLFRIIDQSQNVVGIFGTQYRRSIDRALLRRLMARLKVWYARSLEDQIIFGGDCPSVHLGDWLISAFPLSRPRRRPSIADTLVIGPEALFEADPLDRTILKIQSYRRVVSARLHPLLCALTSAEEVAYCEQRESGSEEASGKFRSMLLDVFGYHFPEERLFSVDRLAVRAYKEFVQANMARLRDDLNKYVN